MRQTRAIEFSTGLFALLGFAALFFLTTQITNREIRFGESNYRLIAKFENVGSLKVGAPVSMAGVTIASSTLATIRKTCVFVCVASPCAMAMHPRASVAASPSTSPTFD